MSTIKVFVFFVADLNQLVEQKTNVAVIVNAVYGVK